MPASWIQFHYRDQCFDYSVRDVDFIQLLDLINKIGDVALKQNVLVPDVFEMHYESKVKKNRLVIKSDSDLLSMFDELEGFNTIDVWLTDTKTPIKEFDLAFQLRKKQREEEERRHRMLEETRRLEREAEENAHFEPLSITVPSLDVDTMETKYVCVYGQEFQFVDDGAPQTSNELNSTTPQTFSDFPSKGIKEAHHDSASTREPPSEFPSNVPLSRKCPTSDRFLNNEIPHENVSPSQKKPSP